MAELADLVDLVDCSAQAKVLVHADPAGAVAGRLDVGFGTSRRDADGTLIFRVRPAQWLVFGEAGRGPDLVEQWTAAAAESGEFVSVIDVTAGRSLLRLTGAASPALLAKVCALDLDGAPDGSTLRSSVAKVNAEIVRDDTGGQRSYLLACERSYGRYLIAAITDAGAEFS